MTNIKRILATLILPVLFICCMACTRRMGSYNKTEQSVAYTNDEESTTQEANKNSLQNLVSEQGLSITEIIIDEFSEMPSGLALVDMRPCVLIAGKAYLYEDDLWNVVSEECFSGMYSGERFCGITENGTIVAELVAQEEYESYPLTSAGTFYNAEEVVKQTEGRAVAQLGSNIFNDSVLVLYEDGKTELFVNGISYPIADDLIVTEVSGDYLLTDAGEVYQVKYIFHEMSSEMSVTLNQLSSDQFVSISACPAVSRCVGIKKDGTVEVWSDVNQELAMEFQRIEKVYMGFSYCIAVDSGGNAHFSAYDTDLGEAINNYFSEQSVSVLYVACEAQRIVVMYESGNIVVIDF